MKDPTIAEAFQAMIGGKFAALTTLCDDDRDIDMIVNTFNTEVTDTANEILGKHRTVKKPWVTNDVLDLCDKRRELKKKKNVTEGAKEYRAINQEVKKAICLLHCAKKSLSIMLVATSKMSYFQVITTC